MKKVLRKNNLVSGIFILGFVCLGIVFAGDVIVKEGIGIFDKIGIGTTSPSEALDLASGNLTTAGSGTLGSLVVDTNTLYVDATNNRIGIGTTSPSQALDLASGNLTTTGTIEGDSITATGTVEGVKFKSTGCTATGTRAVALGNITAASGNYSTAMGNWTTASGGASTAMGGGTTASGVCSTALGGGPVPCTVASGNYSTAIGTIVEATGECSTAIGVAVTAGPADYTTAIGKNFTNNLANSFAVGFDGKDFSVKSGQVDVYGDLVVDTSTLYVDATNNNVGIATTSPTAKLDVNSNIIRLRTSKTPASASAAGNAGDICWDSNYIYICVATNTWKRAALSSW